MGVPGCPTPNKRGYAERESAERHMWSLMTRTNKRRSWRRLKVYRCSCGMFHVGHGSGRGAAA